MLLLFFLFVCLFFFYVLYWFFLRCKNSGPYQVLCLIKYVRLIRDSNQLFRVNSIFGFCHTILIRKHALILNELTHSFLGKLLHCVTQLLPVNMYRYTRLSLNMSSLFEFVSFKCDCNYFLKFILWCLVIQKSYAMIAIYLLIHIQGKLIQANV